MIQERVAKELLSIKAVFLNPNNPFTWASGIKSPIYCDNRLTLSYPKTRRIIEDGLSQLIKDNFPLVNYIMGTATAGIAHASLVAERLDLPMGYVRSSSKSHGRTNTIEGAIIKGANVVVVEDLISTGGSSIKVVETLQEAGFNVLGVVAIFTYNLRAAKDTFSIHKIPYVTLSNYDTLIEVALKEEYISKEEKDKLIRWKTDPTDESWMEE